MYHNQGDNDSEDNEIKISEWGVWESGPFTFWMRAKDYVSNYSKYEVDIDNTFHVEVSSLNYESHYICAYVLKRTTAGVTYRILMKGNVRCLTPGTSKGKIDLLKADGSDSRYDYNYDNTPLADYTSNGIAGADVAPWCNTSKYAMNITQEGNMILNHDEYIAGLHTFSSHDDAIKYLDTGDYSNEIFNNNFPIESDGDDDGKEENSDGTNTSDTDDTPPNHPTVKPTMVAGASNYYTCNIPNINAFIDWLWNTMLVGDSISDILLNSITKIYNNLNQCVTGLRMFPFKITNQLSEQQAVNIVLGRFTSSLGVVNASNFSNLIDMGSIDIAPIHNNFLDYGQNTTLMLYLPYIGFRPLDTNVFMGHKLRVYYLVDITTGSLDAMIYRDGTIVNNYQGTIGIEIPINSSNMSDYISNVIGGVISAGVGTVTGGGANAGALLEGVSNILQNSGDCNSNYSTGTPAPSNSLYYPQQCGLLRVYPNYNRPATYGKNIGYPCMRSYTLSELRGYTKVINPVISFSEVKPTDSEIREIYELLEKGVII